MTDPVTPIGAATLAEPWSARSETAVAPAASQGVRLEVVRAEEAPIYVYRVLDEETGRVLVEIPRKSASSDEDRPGAKVDTTA